MGLEIRPIRKLERRVSAERYVFLVLISLAASVSITRLFLEVTGYPQIGNSELHIAHVLWGGLILFAGAILPLIFINRRILDISAIFTGIGMGLFIDEVGKFITQSNDYFYPAAAPIVYAFFLLVLWLYTLLRNRRSQTARGLLYEVFEQLGEYLDKDLSALEREWIFQRLKKAEELDIQIEYSDLILTLRNFLNEQQDELVAHQDDFFGKQMARLSAFEEKKLPQARYRNLMIWGLLVWGGIMILAPFLSIRFSAGGIDLPAFWAELINTELPLVTEVQATLIIRLAGEMIIGFILILSALFIIKQKEITGLKLANASLLVSICGIYILVFYYDQFSAIVFVAIQFLLFALVRRYQQRFHKS